MKTIHSPMWLENSYAARVAWHRRQARITIAIGVLALALLITTIHFFCQHYNATHTEQTK